MLLVPIEHGLHLAISLCGRLLTLILLFLPLACALYSLPSAVPFVLRPYKRHWHEYAAQ